MMEEMDSIANPMALNIYYKHVGTAVMNGAKPAETRIPSQAEATFEHLRR